MKVQFTSAQTHQSTTLKPLSSTNTAAQSTSSTTTTTTTNTNFCYEPKSVLDLRRSPSPIAADPNSDAPSFSDALSRFDDASLEFDDHIRNNLEDWESLMRDLGLHNDSSPAAAALRSIVPQSNHIDPQFPILSDNNPPPPHSFDLVPNNFPLSDSNSFDFCTDFHIGFNFVDELVRAADCFESNELQLAHVILARLNQQQLRSPVGKPLQRAAFYFKEALQSLIMGSTRSTRNSSSSEVVQAIKAYKNFSIVSPIVMFSNFTANQAILEAVDGSMFIHVVDFDMGFGGQWASFMKEVADRAESRKSNTPILRITAVVPEEYGVESRLIRDNLNQFAQELEIGFEIEFVLIRTFEFLSFKAIKFMEGEKTAVLLSPTIFHRLGTGFLNDLHQISPHVVVVVDGEGVADCGGQPSLRRSVIAGLEFHSTVLETLEAANGGGGEEWIRKIEMFVMRPRIVAAVEAAVGRVAPPWREGFAAAGMKGVGLSRFAEFQAECLLAKVRVRGFHVAKREGEMVLCWHDRALVATSAWRC
ncbi:unnamed protein product [Camellia sinensis]